MNPISSYSTDPLAQLLMSMQQQQMQLTEKMLQVQVSQTVQAVSDGVRGQVLDLYI